MDLEEARSAFLAELDLLVAVAADLTDRDLLAPSRCAGWTTGEVLTHVHLGLQEMLLGCVARTDEAAGTSASDYWRGFPAGPDRDDEPSPDDGMLFIRRLAAAYRRPTGVVRHLTPTAEGVRAAVRALPAGAVRFQGHVLTTGDFVATWAVELAVHHLDLQRELRLPAPAAGALRLGRRTVEVLAGGDLPAGWDDETAVLRGTGREVVDDAGSEVAARLPVFG